MWVLESFSHVVVAGPFKSEAEMAKKLGLSQQYVNRKIRNGNLRFRFDGQDVLARTEKEFVGGGKKASDANELALRLGVSQEAVDKVLCKNSSGLVQTPQGQVKIQKLKPGEKPTLPAVRVLWNDGTEKQDFVSFAAAAKELKIDPKTIPSALKAGRNSFTRKSDGKKFAIEIPAENTPLRKKPKPPSEEQKQKWAEMKRQREIVEEYKRHELWDHCVSIEEMDRRNKIRRAEVEKSERENQPPAEKEPQPPQQPKEETHSEESSSAEEKTELSEEPPSQPTIPRPIQPPIPAPLKKVLSVPVIPPEEPAASAPLSRRNIPWLSSGRKASPEKTFRPPPPPEVVEIREAGKTFPFETPKKA